MAKQFILTPRVEEILRTVHFYRYMTALDITHLLFSPKSITHVREILNKLCGGTDHAENQYLFRFPLPEFTGGKTEKVYTLGSKGRDLLSSDLKIPVDWYFRPTHTRQLSHGLIIHNLTLTRFLVCANAFCQMHSEFTISDVKISYEMEKNKAFKIVPDAWILFNRNNKNFPILLEIDRGTAYKEKLKRTY